MNKGIEIYDCNMPLDISTEEVFWEEIRQSYRLKPDYINLENGYYCIIPEGTLEKYIENIREINYQGAWYFRNEQIDNKKKIAAKLAELLDCPADELIITRNTTESLDAIINGFDWKAGDEVVMAEQDYPFMLEMFTQTARRYGIVNKLVSIPFNPQSDEEIVEVYSNAITDKTRLIMVCHIINITGQILPVRKICDMAHSQGVQVLVDGAHAVAHFKFNIPDLHCDYYGSSLHKWLGAPLGAGMLWMKKENISRIWPLFAPEDKDLNDITRHNHIGTHPAFIDLTIADAIDLYLKIGPERKEKRLRYLSSYWMDKVKHLKNIILYTPSDPTRYCGIAVVGIKGIDANEMADILLIKYRIYTVAVDFARINGCRITPNVYTAIYELDLLIEALTEIATNME